MPNSRSIQVIRNHPGQCYSVARQGETDERHWGPKTWSVRVVQLPSGRWILTRVDMAFELGPNEPYRHRGRARALRRGMEDSRLPGEYESETEAETAARELIVADNGRQPTSITGVPGIRRGPGNPGRRKLTEEQNATSEDQDEEDREETHSPGT